MRRMNYVRCCRIFFCFILSLSINISGQAQSGIHGKVIEKDTGIPVVFASVIYQSKSLQKFVMTDLYGKFEINEIDFKTITVSCVGYKAQTIALTMAVDPANLIVSLESNTLEIKEVIVTPFDNPAIKIMKDVLRNKAKNNFKNYPKYRYQCYFKTTYDLKPAPKANTSDSVIANLSKSLSKKVLFISESVVTCSNVDHMTASSIEATKTSGFKDPVFGQLFFTTFQHAISFYENTISLIAITVSDKMFIDYVSPLSDDCFSNYHFYLLDTYQNANDTIYAINFYPKKGKKFNSLRGRLFVSSNGFALTSIVAEPFEKGLIDFKFNQEYAFFQNHWFPSKLDEEIGFIAMRVNQKLNVYPAYMISSRIDSIHFNIAESKKDINLEKVYVKEVSPEKSEAILNAGRVDKLSKREENTYHFMDSINRKYNLDRWFYLYRNLLTGKLPLGCVDLELSRIYNYNDYEKNRYGFGLTSNDKLSSHFSVGGFWGYGSGDKAYKYGGQFIVELNRYHEVKLKFSVQKNIKEVGFALDKFASNLSFGDKMRQYLSFRFENCVEQKVEFQFRTMRYLKVTAAITLKSLKPLYTYQFKGLSFTSYQADDIRIGLKYALGEELQSIGNQRISNFEGNPIINISYTQGVSIFNSDGLTYHRLEGQIDLMAYKGTIGQSNVSLAAGYTDRTLPYGLLFTGDGSKSSSLPLIMNVYFQTMAPYEFLSDKFVNLFYTHNFGSLLLKTSMFKPEFEVVHNTGWGTLHNESFQGIAFKTKNKIYLESGLIVKNILQLNSFNLFYLNFGIGTFYRYGYYGYDKILDNFALKLALSVSLK